MPEGFSIEDGVLKKYNGTAEDVVGAFLARKTVSRDALFVSSKLRPNILDDVPERCYYKKARENLENTLARLKTDYLDAYMCHSSRYVFQDAILAVMERLKKEGLVRHVGVSVYEPDEALACLGSPRTDFMQLPFSVFDQRMLKSGVFEAAAQAKGKVEIHSRSAFIQGLILMDAAEVPSFLDRAKPIISKIDKLCKSYGVSRIALAMGYVKRIPVISHLVFGVDNLDQLRENIELFKTDLPTEIIEAIAKEFQGLSVDIVMPSLWRRG